MQDDLGTAPDFRRRGGAAARHPRDRGSDPGAVRASTAVATLEGRHGTELFHRVGRRIELTAVGRAFLDEASAVVAHAAVAELMLTEFGGLLRESRSVCASRSIAGSWLPRHLADYRRAHPGIGQRLTVGDAAQVAAAVNDRTAEPAFVVRRGHERGAAERGGGMRPPRPGGRGEPPLDRPRPCRPAQLADTEWCCAGRKARADGPQMYLGFSGGFGPTMRPWFKDAGG